ncbi:MAG: hypothetical protein B7C24_07755 [Bacteroidetes bacterium 4572_77]|nr:MAG: hypothetical protein B7C24_07755 [Bacteroidetes bacterium 4572_77]
MTITAKVRKRAQLLLQTFVVVMVYLFLFFELSKPEHQVWQGFMQASEKINIPLIIFVVLLMPINWLIESLKWRFLVKRIEMVSIKNAFQAVLAGTSISIFTPNRIGDYLGRIFMLKKGDRWDGTIATIVGNISQLLITLIMGSIALLYFSKHITLEILQWNKQWVWVFYLLIILIDTSLIYMYFKFPIIEKQWSRYFDIQKNPFLKHFNLLSEYKRKDLYKVLSFSLLRYAIYSLQFFLVFKAYGLPLDFINGMMMVFFIFFSITIIPSIAIAELGIRGIITIYIFQSIGTGYLSSNPTESLLVSASSLLWFINLALPAFIGGLFIFNLRFFRKNDHL